MKQELNESPGTLYDAAYRELAALERPGWQRYIEQHQPTLAGELCQANARFDAASFAVRDFEWREDAADILAEFKEALEQWRQANLKAIQYFNDHQPPTIAGPDPSEAIQTRERFVKQKYVQVWSDELREHLFFISNDLDRLNKWVPENVKKVAIGLQELRLQQGSITDKRGLAILAAAKKAGLLE
ncbi:MAG: hypothetical protein ABSA82_00340 [Thermacetogeniaceae bacterium]|jgi:hypothetical protein